MTLLGGIVLWFSLSPGVLQLKSVRRRHLRISFSSLEASQCGDPTPWWLWLRVARVGVSDVGWWLLLLWWWSC
uniref:Uncharacterized protein n=1 Tax=Arundo donax TaxID=35708 RepID=A0A0A8Y8Z4_ARUDO